jgi:putative porin
MPKIRHASRRWTPPTLALAIGLMGSPAALAADPQPASAAPDPGALAPAADPSVLQDRPTQNAVVSLIQRLAAKGLLSKRDIAELTLLADADAAEARAQSAMTQAALAEAAAAEARARAIAALAGVRDGGSGTGVSSQPTSNQAAIAALLAAAQTNADAMPATAPLPDSGAPAPIARTAPRTIPAPAARTAVPAAAPAPAEPAVPEDTVRVTYVPEVVKEQLRQEVKQDVLDEAHQEGWATPGNVPDWVTRFRLFGDVRLRYEGDFYPSGNDDTGAFPNFNAINTGAPFDTAGNVFSPQINVDQDRERFRIRARLGSEIDLGQNFSAGLRAATGSDDAPVSENQTLGYAGSGQGGDFSKYSLWLDRAFLKYEMGGAPDEDLVIEAGRFDNPFMSTSMIWANDLAFDGIAVTGKYGFGESVTPFFTVGAFPVFDTDLNFATNNPSKFSSYDKYLYAAQIGASFDLGRSVALKLAVAYYDFKNIEGKLSDPYTPLTISDAGDTDDSRPSFAQFGNTYMALRDIVPDADNDNGQIDQFQYYGLATPFHELAIDERLDYNAFEPFQVSLKAEFVKNLAFNPQSVGAIAVNNRAGSTTSTLGVYDGSATGWITQLTFGDAAIKQRGDWDVFVSYRKVGSDSVVDGFADSDFGLGGTNFKGFTLGGDVAIAQDIWLGVRWMPAEAVAGPTYKINVLQMDLNAKF